MVQSGSRIIEAQTSAGEKLPGVPDRTTGCVGFIHLPHRFRARRKRIGGRVPRGQLPVFPGTRGAFRRKRAMRNPTAARTIT
jgi:hypothetical protein